jgi:hypothetical protein
LPLSPEGRGWVRGESLKAKRFAMRRDQRKLEGSTLTPTLSLEGRGGIEIRTLDLGLWTLDFDPA